MTPKILVVDDELSVTDLLVYNLRKSGYEPLVAADGREALRLLLNFCCGTIYTGVWALLSGISLLPNGPGFLGAVYIGVFEMGVTFVLWMSALRLSRTTAQVSNLIYLAPFLSLFIIHSLVPDNPDAMHRKQAQYVF